MTIQPAFWPLVLLRTTFATTPSPRMMSSMVPSSSARNGDMERRSYISRMKFAILIYTDATLLDALPAGQFDANMRDCLAHADDLRQDGRLLDSQMLEGAATAKAVRVRNGRRTVIDGSFTETKERLARFILSGAKDIEEVEAREHLLRLGERPVDDGAPA